jgi:hypothetical protein
MTQFPHFSLNYFIYLIAATSVHLRFKRGEGGKTRACVSLVRLLTFHFLDLTYAESQPSEGTERFFGDIC